MTVDSVRLARTRDDLGLAPGETVIGGGTWVYSEPQPDVRGIVDLMSMKWPAIELDDDGLHLAATCTLAELTTFGRGSDLPAAGLFAPACDALLGSWKIHRFATVGGNICLALPAGPMTSLFAGLGAEALVWTPDGGERRLAVADLVTGNHTNALAPGEVVRSIHVTRDTLNGAVAMRRMSLIDHGRSGVFVVGRRTGNQLVITITAATPRPYVLTFDALPAPDDVTSAVDGISDWFDDPHGSPAWRRAMSVRLALEIREELA